MVRQNIEKGVQTFDNRDYRINDFFSSTTDPMIWKLSVPSSTQDSISTNLPPFAKADPP